MTDFMGDGGIEIAIAEEKRAIGKSLIHFHVAFPGRVERVGGESMRAARRRDAANAERSAIAVG